MSRSDAPRIRFIDSHTAGEPTRIVLAGGPPLGAGSVAERCRRFAAEHDRSPCGTGTSAKLACLAADGRLAPGATWIQEGILGTRFTASFVWADAAATTGEPAAGPLIVPTIVGRAHVTARGELVLDPDDPFCWGRRDSP